MSFSPPVSLPVRFLTCQGGCRSASRRNFCFVTCSSMCTPGGLTHDLSPSPLFPSMRRPPRPSSLTRSARDPFRWLLHFSGLPGGPTNHTCTAMSTPTPGPQHSQLSPRSAARAQPVHQAHLSPGTPLPAGTRATLPGAGSLCAAPSPRRRPYLRAQGPPGSGGSREGAGGMGRGPRGTRRSPGCGLPRLLRLVLLLSLARVVSGEPDTDGECGAPGAQDASRSGSGGAESGRGRIMEAERRGARQAAAPERWGV